MEKVTQCLKIGLEGEIVIFQICFTLGYMSVKASLTNT